MTSLNEMMWSQEAVTKLRNHPWRSAWNATEHKVDDDIDNLATTRAEDAGLRAENEIRAFKVIAMTGDMGKAYAYARGVGTSYLRRIYKTTIDGSILGALWRFPAALFRETVTPLLDLAVIVEKSGKTMDRPLRTVYDLVLYVLITVIIILAIPVIPVFLVCDIVDKVEKKRKELEGAE